VNRQGIVMELHIVWRVVTLTFSIIWNFNGLVHKLHSLYTMSWKLISV